ncbi:PHO2 [Candida margitis]|uniref:PHO2 n=1 Tax=Candida margitis TaxID=1775924 RepID=UPI002226C3F3|nr:PHO2 [Candida margitis]KAI5962026.1 PHO2 [Candida margitis]
MSETTISPRNNFSFNINPNGSISTTSATTATIVSTASHNNTPQKRIRATGEVLNFLISEFEKNPSPSPDRRKYISDKAQMNEKAVRIWFQNRRAKQKKHERSLRQGHSSVSSAASSSSYSSASASANTAISSFGKDLASHHTTFDFIQKHVPIEINEKYSFIDCTSLSVGSWQRIKSGIHKQSLLQNNLINLSPFNLNNVMQQVDLLVLLSRKNHELNYFFSATSNDSRILFRIFYPLTAISNCSLHDNNLVNQQHNHDNNNSNSNNSNNSNNDHELRIHLCHQPKFSVYFFNGLNSTTNQWSICDDFSEGQQVSRAYSSSVDQEYRFKDFDPKTGDEEEGEHEKEANSDVPHVLVGSKIALNYLSTYISQSIVGLNNHNNNCSNYNTPNTSAAATAAAATSTTADVNNSQFGIPNMTSIPPETIASMKHHSFDLGVPSSGQDSQSTWPYELSSLALNIDTNNNTDSHHNHNNVSFSSQQNMSVPSSATATAVTTFNGSPFSTTSNQFYLADTPQSSQSFGNYNNNKLDPLNFTTTNNIKTTSPEDVLSLSSDHQQQQQQQQQHLNFAGTGVNGATPLGMTKDSITTAYIHGNHQTNNAVGLSDSVPYLNNNDFDHINLISGENGATPSLEYESSHIDFIDFTS